MKMRWKRRRGKGDKWDVVGLALNRCVLGGVYKEEIIGWGICRECIQIRHNSPRRSI